MSADIAEYVELHFKQINRYKIDCEPTDWQDLLVPEENWHYFQTTTSSLRLDAISFRTFTHVQNKSVTLD